MIEGDDVGKKALIGVSLAVLAVVGVVGGKVYMNNNEKLVLETTLNKYSEGKGYKHGALGMTQELDSLLN